MVSSINRAVWSRANTPSLLELLPQVMEIAALAGTAIWGIYKNEFSVFHKPDFSPVTEADLTANEIIINGLARLSPRWPVVSEEESTPEFTLRSKWDYHWLVDPLDGTREFIKRNDEFTVNIALIHRHRPILGVIYVPATQVTYYATDCGGAFKLDLAGKIEQIQVRPWDGRHIVIAGSRAFRTGLFEQFLSRFVSSEVVSLGSSLKSCLIAEGGADVYARFGPTAEWDTAAAQCIVEAAGGRVCDLNLRDLTYNQRPSLTNPSFIVVGDLNHDWSTFLPSFHE